MGVGFMVFGFWFRVCEIGYRKYGFCFRFCGFASLHGWELAQTPDSLAVEGAGLRVW